MKVLIKIIPDEDSKIVFPNFEDDNVQKQSIGKTLRLLCKRLISTGSDRVLQIQLGRAAKTLINETGREWDWEKMEAGNKAKSEVKKKADFEAEKEAVTEPLKEKERQKPKKKPEIKKKAGLE